MTMNTPVLNHSAVKPDCSLKNFRITKKGTVCADKLRRANLGLVFYFLDIEEMMNHLIDNNQRIIIVQ
jgi:hypothetical protein